MLLGKIIFSAFLVGAALGISAFTFALTENPFHSFPESIELHSVPLLNEVGENENTRQRKK